MLPRLRRIHIHCEICHFEGRAEVRAFSRGTLILIAALVVLGLLYPPSFVLLLLVFAWLYARRADPICPKCKWRHPTPLAQYRGVAK